MSLRWIACAAVSVAMMSATAANAVTLAANGKASCSIVISKDAIAPEKRAAAELQGFLKQVTRAEFAIRTESQVKPDAAQILVGPSQRAKRLAADVDWASLGHDGIVIRTVGNKLILAGGRTRGTLYAVYTFLEDTVGCRWWTGTESTIPSKPTLKIPDLKVCYVPKLRYREAFYRDPLEHPEFAVKCKLNGHMYAIKPEYGDHYKILGWCHTSYALVPPGQHAGPHPDWYAERDGKRSPNWGQLCWSNPEMRKELTKVALEWIKKDPAAGIISISQNDCAGNCTCAQCKAIDDENGTPAGSLITGINAIAEEIEKVYPDQLVETLAYQYTRKAPSQVKPRHNVVVRLCTIECDFSRPLDSDGNAAFRDDMKKWKAISPNLYVWDYVTDFASYIQPQCNMRVLAPNLRFFEDNNVIGVFEQGDCATTVGDFVRLRSWLLAHLEWDTSRDPKQLTTEFLNGYYGPAAPYLQKYLDLMHDAWEKSGMGLSCYNGNLSFLTLPVMTEATKLFDEAAKAVANDAVISTRVRRDRMPLDHMWLVLYDGLKRQAEAEKVAFVGPSNPKALCTEFIKMARDLKANNYSEGMGFETYVPSLEARFAGPPPEPAEFAKLPKGDILQMDAGSLAICAPNVAKLVDDPKATGGKAAFMTAGHTEWAIQYHVSESVAKAHPGRWKCYIVARAEGAKAGGAFQYGVYRGGELARMGARLEQSADGEYHTYYAGSHEVAPATYIWLAPYGDGNAVKGIYVDRMILVRDKG